MAYKTLKLDEIKHKYEQYLESSQVDESVLDSNYKELRRVCLDEYEKIKSQTNSNSNKSDKHFIDMNFGGLSDLSDITFKDKNYLSPIRASFVDADDYWVMQFSVTVKEDTDSVINLIDKTLKENKLDKNMFKLIQKNFVSSLVLSTESPSKICTRITNDIVFYGDIITDAYSRLSNLNFEELSV